MNDEEDLVFGGLYDGWAMSADPDGKGWKVVARKDHTIINPAGYLMYRSCDCWAVFDGNRKRLGGQLARDMEDGVAWIARVLQRTKAVPSGETKWDICLTCKGLTVADDKGTRFDVWIVGGRYRPQGEHHCKVCACGKPYSNEAAHEEDEGHPAERVVCNHLFNHCLTWEDHKRAWEMVEYTRKHDPAVLDMRLENARWCPNLKGNIPPEPEPAAKDEESGDRES